MKSAADFRVYEITGPRAWIKLFAQYPMDVTFSRRHDWWRAGGHDGSWLLPDWSAVASDFDAVHLSVTGYLTTAGRALPVGDARSMLAGWNADETYWLSDVLEHHGDPVPWQRDTSQSSDGRTRHARDPISTGTIPAGAFWGCTGNHRQAFVCPSSVPPCGDHELPTAGASSGGTTVHKPRARALGVSLGCALAFTLVATATVPAVADDHENLPGEPSITLPINDSEAGGTYDQDFNRAYAGTTPDGTPVYIYVPEGTPLDGSEPTGVASLDPAFDHNPADEFAPCADRAASEYVLTQAQIDYMGDQLSSQIVAVDEEHFGPMDAADPDEPASDSLVMVVYNVQDANYYDCAETTYTAGYFAPDFIESAGMNVIVIDAFDWANRVGPDDSEWRDDNPDNDQATLYEGVIAHELEHLLHNYSDPGELSWVDEGLADFAVFLNGYDVGGSHLTYHQVFYAETSLTRWGGGLENYGAAYTFFQYVWEQAGGNGDGTFTPDLQNDGAGGDLLIQRIFENQADGMDGVQAAIDAFNAETSADLRTAEELFQDWAVTVYLDDEESQLFDIKAVDFGDPAFTTWTIDIADDQFWGDRGNSQGAQPSPKWNKRTNAQSPTALPYGLQVERFRNPGPNVTVSLDGEDSTQVAPHSGETHWYAGYESQSDNILDVEVTGEATSLDFWTWHFIEEGWDYGFAEALVGGEWVTVPLVNDAGTVVTSNDDPHANNTEGNGLTGTSGGAYFVDEPVYVHYTAQLPDGATDVRFRYSTDAAYLDTGWFIDDVLVNGSAAAVSSAEGEWFETTGLQDNNWTLQVVASCDLTPGTDSDFEITDGAGNYVYRLEGDAISQSGFNTKCANGPNRDFATLVSNLPTGDLMFLDAEYTLTVKNNGNARNG